MPQSTGSSLFGAFGQNNNQQQQQQQQNQPQSSIFGTNTTPNAANKPTFGLSAAAPPPLFGRAGTNGTPSAQNLSASVDQNVFGHNQFLTSLGPGPHVVNLSELEDKKQSPPVSSFPHYMRHVPRPHVPTIGRLRGFSNAPADASSGLQGRAGLPLRASSVGPAGQENAGMSSPFASRPAFGGSLSEALGASGSLRASPGLSPEAFRPKASVKKLTMPHRVDGERLGDEVNRGAESFRASSLPPSSTSSSKIRWNVGVEMAVKVFPMDSAVQSGRTVPSTSAARLSPGPAPATSKPIDNADPAEGEYWARPSIAELQKSDWVDLSRVENFTVGRVGYGEVTFLQPVDLTTLKVIADIPGGVVEFTERACVVYVDESIKPPVGEGLNVPAKITLQNCWPRTKDTGEIVKDENHSRFKKHIKVLHNMPNTTFISFDVKTGLWSFRVEHFTRYGLDDDDDDDAESNIEVEQDLAQAPIHEAIPNPRWIEPLPLPELPPRSASHSSAEVDNESRASDDEETEELDTLQEPRSWPSRLGLDPHRVNVMQASFFPDVPDEEDRQPAAHSSYSPFPKLSNDSGAVRDVSATKGAGTLDGGVSMRYLCI